MVLVIRWQRTNCSSHSLKKTKMHAACPASLRGFVLVTSFILRPQQQGTDCARSMTHYFTVSLYPFWLTSILRPQQQSTDCARSMTHYFTVSIHSDSHPFCGHNNRALIVLPPCTLLYCFSLSILTHIPLLPGSILNRCLPNDSNSSSLHSTVQNFCTWKSVFQYFTKQ